MKKLLSLSILLSTMALTACGGGDSDSSGGSINNTTNYTKTLSNGNVYKCPSETALTSCTTDGTCKTASCTATKIVTPVVDQSTLSACEVSGTNIYGTKGKSCTFSISGFNGGKPQTLVCNTTGGGSTNGISFGNSFTLNGMVLSCK